MLFIGLVLSFGPVLYKTVERIQKTLILAGVPAVFLLSLLLSGSADWVDLVKGSIGLGSGYLFLPEGIAVATFLAALAYAGAGGNLNLAQSFYIKEKGYASGILQFAVDADPGRSQYIFTGFYRAFAASYNCCGA